MYVLHERFDGMLRNLPHRDLYMLERTHFVEKPND